MKKRVGGGGGLLQSAEGESGRKNSLPSPSSAAAVQRMKLSPSLLHSEPPSRAQGPKIYAPFPFPWKNFAAGLIPPAAGYFFLSLLMRRVEGEASYEIPPSRDGRV